MKTLYPDHFAKNIQALSNRHKRTLNILLGKESVYKLITEKKYIAWEVKSLFDNEREMFLQTRKKYLLY